ncbi:ABC transporter ATP-binding protein [Marinococcus luteus]|uniref:ABC transporter ATP-binding protein n=1 Tax=Marinococcus luteus TaxID=1122204 RepID=UPI002ACC563D|nr:ABC transporter ATP-binding protein [Marinococcus luteus]MDZ5782346.1 ABC transporter ATP-binding protein [Marinococcus luteus]
MAEVQVENVTAGYGKSSTVVDQVSFHATAGEMIGIVGPNGSGKSTLLRVMAGLHEVSSGSIRYKNKLLSSFTSSQRAKTVAYLPQFGELTAAYSARQVVEMGRYAYQKSLWPAASNKEDERVIQNAMQQVHVWSKRFHSFHALSGGEKQRVLIARLLAQEPECLLLDEPTNHLDIHYRIELLNYIRRWASEQNRTVVVVMHDIQAAALYCDRVLMLSRGRTEAFDEPAAVFTEKRLAEVYQADIHVSLQHEIKAPAVHWRPPQPEGNGAEDVPLSWSETAYQTEAVSRTALNVYAPSLKKLVYGSVLSVDKIKGAVHIFTDGTGKRPAHTIQCSPGMRVWRKSTGSREAVFGSGQSCFLWIHMAEGWPAQEISSLQLYIQRKAFEWMHARGITGLSHGELKEIMVTAPVKKIEAFPEEQLHWHYLHIGKLIESLLDDYNSASG